MNIAICDDEADVRKALFDLTLKEDGITTIDEFSDAGDLLLSPTHYHLIFLDIQMPGISGIEAAKRIKAQGGFNCIVFVTGAKEYVFDAFDVGALHYLLKPIDAYKFSEIYRRAYDSYKSYDASLEEKLIIRTKKGTNAINRRDILYVESQLKKLEIHTLDKTVAFYGTMRKLEHQLGGAFYRCHRSYLVNMAHIEGYDSDSITLSNKEMVYLSKDRYAGFAKAYLDYLRNGGACFV